MARKKALTCCKVCGGLTDGWATIPDRFCSECFETYLMGAFAKHGRVCGLCSNFNYQGSAVGGKGWCRVRKRVYGISSKPCSQFCSKLDDIAREREDFG